MWETLFIYLFIFDIKHNTVLIQTGITYVLEIWGTYPIKPVGDQHLKLDSSEVYIPSANFSKVNILNAINWKILKILYHFE